MKNISLFLVIFLITNGCVSKPRISTEDKKLISSDTDEVLYIYKDGTGNTLNQIGITRNGFYPRFIVGYLNNGRLDVKRLIKNIHKFDLIEIKKKVLLVKNEYPSFNTIMLHSEDMDTLISSSYSTFDKNKLLLKRNPCYISHFKNKAPNLISIARKECNHRRDLEWNDSKNSCSSAYKTMDNNPNTDWDYLRKYRLRKSLRGD